MNRPQTDSRLRHHLSTSLPKNRCEKSFARSGKISKLLLFGVPILLLGTVFGVAMLPLSNDSAGHLDPAAVVTETVTRDLFRVTINDRGTLDSQKNSILTSNVPGVTTIISIVPEGASVKKGDLVCQLDSSSLVDKSRQQKIKVTQAESNFAIATENEGIQKTQNDSDIEKAQLKWTLAKLDLEKYLEGELTQERNTIQGQITLKEEELTRSNESLSFTKRMVLKGYRSQSDLEAQQLSVTKSEISLKVEKEKLTVLDKYTSKRKIAELKANAKEFERELERVKRKANSAMAKAKADLEARKLTLEVESEQYKRWLKQIEDSKLIAPQDGVVVYSNQSTNRRSSKEIVIEEGASVRERQAILNLPDFTKMEVNARIHESAINQLETGQAVLIRINAHPDTVFNGTIADISSVPMSGSWPNYDLKEYPIVIHLTDPVEVVSHLKPGLTAEFEVIVSDRKDVLQVPVQAVINLGSQYFSYVLIDGQPQRVEITVGESNDTNVEILTGLKEGMAVIMNPRSLFGKELNKLDEQIQMSEKANQQGQKKNPSGGASTQKKSKVKPKKKKKPQQKGGGRKNPAAMIQKMDKNGDGVLQKSELPERMQAHFDKFDADKDGSLTAGELSKVFAGSGRQ